MTTAAARIIADIEHEARFRYDQARIEGAALRGELGVEPYLIAHNLIDTPAPLDCADLAMLLRNDKTLAVIALGRLRRRQYVRQAHAFASYLNEQHGKALSADDVLAYLDQELGRYGVGVR